MTERKIIWEYWRNPYDDVGEFVDEEQGEELSAWDKTHEAEEKTLKYRPVMATPMGFVPVQPFQSFSAAFNFWVGHATFNISQEIFDMIDTIEGVEISSLLSRYSFRVAIGKAFKSSDVKLAIQRALNAMPPTGVEINPTLLKLDRETQEKVYILKETIKKEYPYWAVYVMPNGEMDVAGSNAKEGYDLHLSLYKHAQEIAGGIIYQYA